MHLAAPLLLSLAIVGTATAQTMIAGPALPNGLQGAVGDVDADGRVDHVILGGGTWSIRSGASGALLPALARPAPTVAFTRSQYAPVGDVNADGHDDLAYAVSYQSAQAFVEIVSGSNGSTLFLWSLPICEVTVDGGADYDADGYSDVAFHFYAVNPQTLQDTQTLLVRSGRNAAILLQQTFTGTSSLYSLRPLGDYNGDGYDDLGLDDSSYYWANTTTTGLRGPAFTPQLVGIDVRVLGDTNGNGTTDLCRGQVPLIEIADGNGTHRLLLNYLTATALGDLDGDGCADVLRQSVSQTQTLSGRTLTVMPGAATAHSTFPIGDFDGDGRDEAAAATGMTYQWSDPTLPSTSTMIRRGAPGTTSTGRRPRFKVRGHAGLGNTAFFDLRGAVANGTAFLVVGPAVDVDLTVLGAPGNRAYANPLWAHLLVADANGLARYQVTMPASAALLGATSTVQGFVFDPPANALGLVTSDAVDVATRN